MLVSLATDLIEELLGEGVGRYSHQSMADDEHGGGAERSDAEAAAGYPTWRSTNFDASPRPGFFRMERPRARARARHRPATGQAQELASGPKALVRGRR